MSLLTKSYRHVLLLNKLSILDTYLDRFFFQFLFTLVAMKIVQRTSLKNIAVVFFY